MVCGVFIFGKNDEKRKSHEQPAAENTPIKWRKSKNEKALNPAVYFSRLIP